MNSNTTQKSDSLVSLDTASLVILVIAMCSQLDVRHVGPDTWGEGLGFMTKTLAVALSDVVFAGVVAWFVVRTAQLNAWSKLWWPPLACWALALAAVVALTHSVTIHDSVIAKLQPAPGHHHGHGLRYALFHNNDQTRVAFAVVVQFIGYFLFGPWVFVNLLHDRRGGELVSRRRAALLSLLGITAAGAALGLLQAFIFHKPPLPTEVHLGDDALAVYFGAPRGLYGTPNIYAGCLAFVLPLLWAWAASGSKGVGLTGLKPSTGLVTVGLITAAALFSMVSVWAIAALVGGAVLAIVLVAPKEKMGIYLGVLLAVTVLPLAIPTHTVRDARADFMRLDTANEPVKRQFIEWQAALGWNVPRERAFATGVGPGNYQLNIGPYYSTLPAVEKMPPDSNNLYLVQAVSIGLLGLSALLWMVAEFWKLAWSVAKAHRDWLGTGVLASLTAWLFLNNFSALVVRGAGLILAFVFALAVIAAETAPGELSDPGDTL